MEKEIFEISPVIQLNGSHKPSILKRRTFLKCMINLPIFYTKLKHKLQA